MPSLEYATQFQTAVLWAFRGYDRHGQAAVTDVPVEVPVRWNTGFTEAADPKGNIVTYDGDAQVTQRVDIGSVMWLGTLDELLVGVVGEVLPSPWKDQLFEVKSYNGTPDVYGKDTVHMVRFMRYKGRLPTIKQGAV